MNSIQIDKQTLNDIFVQAKTEYPGEACGWILKDAGGKLTYFPAENLQDKYHKLDPESYPRTVKDAFLMDSLKLNNAIEAATSAGGELFSIVHSHIDCGAYFSEEDKLQMSLPDGSGPVFPASNYLVVSVNKGEEGETAAFVFNPSTKDYDLVQVELV